MEELNRNTRTLIMSFVIALFALIPLRFVEAGQMMEIGSSDAVAVLPEEANYQQMAYASQETAVLGAETDNQIPASILNDTSAKLEAPYDVIDGGRTEVLGASTEIPSRSNNDCISRELAKEIIDEMYGAGASNSDMQLIANSVCR